MPVALAMSSAASRSVDDTGLDRPADQRARIVTAARERLFKAGYGPMTMDDLAADLGMSKKTLYVYFPGKRELCMAVIDAVAVEIRGDADELLRHPQLTFLEKLRGFAQGMAERFGRLRPEVLADMERLAPEIHRHLVKVRAKTIPYVFGRLIEEGQLAGIVRDNVSPIFAAEFHLHAMQGLMQPATLRRLGLRPDQAIEQAIRLLFGGLLAPAAHKEYEKLFPT
jgi:AcrR family transcriptional regulator